MTNTQPKESTKDKPSTSPGELLYRAREKLELSVNEIAARLRLDQKVILSIESDDYSNMPAATYVRGYLRSYARIVNLDGDELIALYDGHAPEPPEILPEVKHRTQITSSDKPVKVVTYLITLGLVLLLLIWWQSHFVIDKLAPLESEMLAETADITEIKKTYTEPDLDYEYQIVVHPDDWQTANSAQEQTPATALLEPEANTTEDREAAQTEDIMTSGDPLSLHIPDEQDLAVSAGHDSPLATATGPDNLLMQLSADCWIEVYDAAEKRIYMNLAKAGNDVLVNGTAPFRVLLGNAEKVRVIYNGAEFDIKPFSIAGVARFTLGE